MIRDDLQLRVIPVNDRLNTNAKGNRGSGFSKNRLFPRGLARLPKVAHIGSAIWATDLAPTTAHQAVKVILVSL